MKSPLYDQYLNEVRIKLQEEFGIKNPMNVPQIEKICINVGMGSYLQKLSSKDYSLVEQNIINITGRKPVLRKAKLSVSNFKLRQGQPVGMFVTLRKQAAYNFLYKLLHVVYPRVRDFRGVKRNIFDQNGNCSFGFKDYTVFPETTVPEDSRKIHGLQVTIVIKHGDKKQSIRLMELFKFPFMKKIQPVNA
jgi:large subunit ribosomal protein L5